MEMLNVFGYKFSSLEIAAISAFISAIAATFTYLAAQGALDSAKAMKNSQKLSEESLAISKWHDFLIFDFKNRNDYNAAYHEVAIFNLIQLYSAFGKDDKWKNYIEHYIESREFVRYYDRNTGTLNNLKNKYTEDFLIFFEEYKLKLKRKMSEDVNTYKGVTQ